MVYRIITTLPNDVHVSKSLAIGDDGLARELRAHALHNRIILEVQIKINGQWEKTEK